MRSCLRIGRPCYVDRLSVRDYADKIPMQPCRQGRELSTVEWRRGVESSSYLAPQGRDLNRNGGESCDLRGVADFIE